MVEHVEHLGREAGNNNPRTIEDVSVPTSPERQRPASVPAPLAAMRREFSRIAVQYRDGHINGEQARDLLDAVQVSDAAGRRWKIDPASTPLATRWLAWDGSRWRPAPPDMFATTAPPEQVEEPASSETETEGGGESVRRLGLVAAAVVAAVAAMLWAWVLPAPNRAASDVPSDVTIDAVVAALDDPAVPDPVLESPDTPAGKAFARFIEGGGQIEAGGVTHSDGAVISIWRLVGGASSVDVTVSWVQDNNGAWGLASWPRLPGVQDAAAQPDEADVAENETG